MGKYIQRFGVVGTKPFPIDMLRYDYAYPSNQDSVEMINLSIAEIPTESGAYCVRLSRVIDRKETRPTVERWHSMGWVVDLQTISIEKY